MVTGVDDLFVGRYELGEVLGSGGTGVVRRARDTVLERPVALKLLRAGTSDEVVRARLRAEAQLAGALVHPGVAQVYDYGEDDSGDEPAPYIVMQYVEGTSLWHVLRERRTLPAEEVMDLVAQTASALTAAHGAGIVHRDLKPANILVTDDGRAVVVDFGIARTLDAEPLTATGTIIGTADYISPEQTRGETATTLSDVYSLGMVAYECLSGHKPFHRETQVATALAHLQDEAPQLGGDVPAGVRRLVTRMIAKDADARPTAAEVSEAAARLRDLAGAPDPTQPVLPPPPPPAAVRAVRTPIWRAPALRSRRLQVGAAAVAVTLALTAFVAARPSAVRVPDLRGMSAAAAVDALERRDLDMERRLVDDSSARRGVVLGQDPAPGTSSEHGSVVVVEVASGETSLAPEDVSGLGYERAARVLVAHGLVPVRQDVERPGGDGTVVTATPVGRLPVGTTVTLTVGVAPSRPTPGMTPSAGKPDKPKGHGKAKGHGHEDDEDDEDDD
jgi:serine/threonine-protein kinase